MNMVGFQSVWSGLVNKEPVLENLNVRENAFIEDQFQIGGKVEIHRLGPVLQEIERHTKGFLQKVECRFETTMGNMPILEIQKLGFNYVNGALIFKNTDFVLSLSTIEDESTTIWKLNLQMIGYSVPNSCGNVLSRLISLVKYEMDIKNQNRYLAVV